MKKLIVLAALLVACVVLPVQAESTPGNRGPAKVDETDRSGINVPPGIANPIPLPFVSNPGASPLRLDAAKAISSLGTVTRNADGTTTRKRASGKAADLLNKDREQSGATGPQERDRLVVLTDDRVQIVSAEQFPETVVGWIWTGNADGSWGNCTGTLIGPRTVITAAHCIFNHDKGGWGEKIFFYPGNTSIVEMPMQYAWQSAHIFSGYLDNYVSDYNDVMPWDLGLIILSEPAGEHLGWLGFATDDGSPYSAKILGYPGDKPEGTMWLSECDIGSDAFSDLYLVHFCDTYSGSSGSSVFAVTTDYFVRAVNVAENEFGNFAVRLIPTYYDWVLSLRE